MDTLFQDCVKFPQIHRHAIGHLGMPNILHRLKSDIQGVSAAWFVPLKIDKNHYVFFGFPSMAVTDKKVPDAFVADLFTLLEAKHATQEAAATTTRMAVMERYVKEVGHDIASSVQSTIAKLRNIRDGLIPIEYIPAKASETESEIMAIYRVADGLGLTMEPNYQIREFSKFDVVNVCKGAISLHESEAQERHVTFDMRSSENSIVLTGDAQAFEQFVGHLLSNAVKYSFGGSKTYVNLSCDSEYASIKVINNGIELPSGDDFKKIWDFGFRGEEALARHVNGSGIGLFTVRKIVVAHHGTITAQHEVSSKLTTFTARFPLASYLRKRHPELFIDAIANGSHEQTP